MTSTSSSLLKDDSRSLEQDIATVCGLLLLKKFANLPSDERADCYELLNDFQDCESEDEKQEILLTILEILMAKPVQVGSIEQWERDLAATPEGASAAKDLQRQAKGFGENLRRLRGEKAISQQQLAKASNMTQPQISYLERGEHRPQEATVEKLAEALGVAPETLLT